MAGKLVREYLADTGWDVDCCSRGDSSDPHHRKLDLLGSKSKAMEVLRDYDWAVACIGPFEKWMDKAANLCVEAGTNYIDINDSIEAREAILAVPAEKGGVIVMTGAGLCPGISTALLLGEAGEPVRSVRAVLRIGAGQPSGAASVQSMFETIHGGYRVLRSGQIQMVSHSDTVGELVGYECPDMGAVPTVFPGIEDYSYHVGFAALKPKTVRDLQTKKMFTLPGLSRWLAKKAAVGVTRKALEENDPKPAKLEITMITPEERIVATASGLTSYQFTAVAAATCLKELASMAPDPGTYEIAQLPEMCTPLLRECRERGADVTVRREGL